jgi:hypothetical protein
MKKAFPIAFLTLSIGYASCPNSAVVFTDDFEYAVNKSDSPSCSLFTSTGGWDSVKSINCTGSSRGYLYTTSAIPGYSRSFPGRDSSRVLGMEAKPFTFQGQTDFYLELGSPEGSIGQIPANHWIQFWVYANNYGQEQSRFSESKWIYPNRATFYPATANNEGYVYMFGLAKRSKSTLYADPCPGGDSFGCDRAYILTGWESGGVDNHIPYLNTTFGPNLSIEPPIMPNTWTLVKLHVDLSGTDPRAAPGQAVYEQWIRRQGSSQWIKTTEYIGGVTIVNSQPIAFTPQYTDGFRTFRMPTTTGATTNAKGDWFDFWLYLDDFVLATSEADLPVYDDGGISPRLSPPTNLQLIAPQ